VLRRIIYVAAMILASATVGYVIALETRPPVPVAETPAAEHETPPAAGTIDWTRVADEDLRVSEVFLTARNVGVEAALDSLQALAQADVNIARRGHNLAHALGRYFIDRNDDDPAVIARCRPAFQAGCYHGVLEGYLASVAEVNAHELTGFCSDLAEPGMAIIAARECAHGLGHGLLERVAYQFEPALEACDAFRAHELREECHDGVFMQNLVNGEGLPGSADVEGESAEGAVHQHGTGSEHAAQAAGFHADDLSFPCNTVKEAYQPSCWSYQPVAIRRFLGDPGPRTLFTCDEAPEAAQERCYAGYGKQTLARYDNDTGTMIELCALAVAPNDEACLSGVVEVLIDREWGPQNALLFCKQVQSMGRDPAECYQALGARIALLHAKKSDTEAVCARAEDPRFVSACMKGADGG
jgi:hypothetical protein